MNLIKIGFIFIVYTFVTVLTFYAISTPIEMLGTGLDDADFGLAEDEMDSYYSNFWSALVIALALFLACPITWFVMKIFSREPSYFMYRRY